MTVTYHVVYFRGGTPMILNREWIEGNRDAMKEWEQEAYDYFKGMMENRDQPYPCVPGVQGFQKDMIRYGFASGEPEAAGEKLASMLSEYTRMSRSAGTFTSLVVFFEWKEGTVDGFRDRFWALLNQLHADDPVPWPEGISEDPSHHSWEFCHHGESYFAFCATPAHQKRKSRHFPYFMVAFQPRWVFEDINSGTPLGQKMKKVIRDRLEKYDEVEVHPSLKWYGQEDNFEWQQYYLGDDDASFSKCPFLNSLKAAKR